jgi:hypothetical protein
VDSGGWIQIQGGRYGIALKRLPVQLAEELDWLSVLSRSSPVGFILSLLLVVREDVAGSSIDDA